MDIVIFSLVQNNESISTSEKRDGKSGHLKTLSLNAFGKKFQMPLKQSRNLLSPYAKIVDTYTDPRTGEISQRTISIVADPDQYPNQVCLDQMTENPRPHSGFHYRTVISLIILKISSGHSATAMAMGHSSGEWILESYIYYHEFWHPDSDL